MDRTAFEMVLEADVLKDDSIEPHELTDLQLALVGGGSGEVVFH